MKYNVPLQIKENDSLSMLLEYIEPGTTVLEFGCANGRMTKYMQEVLNCQVYIVEYEKDAYEDALAFAAGGLCSDIMKFEWETFFDVKFDYVVFADVLEHLPDPNSVLKATKTVLKDEGKLLVSVPNIGHNDIIIKLIQETFEYTKIGLLDDTHIHFFSLNGLEENFNDSGYIVEQLKYTTIPTGNTEQFWNAECNVDRVVKNALNERPSGEIYQFIICAHKRVNSAEQQKELGEIKRPMMKGKLYLDTGNGFAEETTMSIFSCVIGKGIYKLKDTIRLPENVKRVRFDLIEDQECYIINNNIVCDKGTVEVRYSSNVQTDNGILLLGKDPFFEVNSSEDHIGLLNCEIDFVVAGDAFIEQLIGEMLDIQDKYFGSKQELDVSKQELEKSKQELDASKQELENRAHELENKEREIEKNKEQILLLNEKYEETKKESHVFQLDYRAIIAMREREIREYKILLDEQVEKTQRMEEEKDQFKNKNYELQHHIEAMEATVSWRITKGLRDVRKLFRK